MKTISLRKETNDFLKHLYKKTAYSPNYYTGIPKSGSLKYLGNLKEGDLRRVASDPLWVNYPRWKNKRTKGLTEEALQEFYGPELENVFAKMILVDKDLCKKIVKYAVGIMLIPFLKSEDATIIKACINRALKSKDERVRLAAIKVASVGQVAKLKKDKSFKVRLAVISRIGISNCYMDYLNDESMAVKAKAIIAAPISSFDYNAELSSALKKPNMTSIEVIISENILSKMPEDEILFYLDLLHGNNFRLREILAYRVNFS